MATFSGANAGFANDSLHREVRLLGNKKDAAVFLD
jgi:hypothetical protein